MSSFFLGRTASLKYCSNSESAEMLGQLLVVDAAACSLNKSQTEFLVTTDCELASFCCGPVAVFPELKRH